MGKPDDACKADAAITAARAALALADKVTP